MGNHDVNCEYCGKDLRGLSGGHANDCPTHPSHEDHEKEQEKDPHKMSRNK